MPVRPSGLVVPANRSYEDAMRLVASEPAIEGVSRLIQPVILIDDLTRVGNTVAAATLPPTPAPPAGTSVGGYVIAGQPVGYPAGSNIWQAYGGGDGTTETIVAGGMRLVGPPVGWLWRVEAVYAQFATGTTPPSGNGNDPFAFSIAPGAMTAADRGAGPTFGARFLTFGRRTGVIGGAGGLASATKYFVALERGFGGSGMEHMFAQAESGAVSASDAYSKAGMFEWIADANWNAWLLGALPEVYIAPGGSLGVSFVGGAGANGLTTVSCSVLFTWFKAAAS